MLVDLEGDLEERVKGANIPISESRNIFFFRHDLPQAKGGES